LIYDAEKRATIKQLMEHPYFTDEKWAEKYEGELARIFAQINAHRGENKIIPAAVAAASLSVKHEQAAATGVVQLAYAAPAPQQEIMHTVIVNTSSAFSAAALALPGAAAPAAGNKAHAKPGVAAEAKKNYVVTKAPTTSVKVSPASHSIAAKAGGHNAGTLWQSHNTTHGSHASTIHGSHASTTKSPASKLLHSLAGSTSQNLKKAPHPQLHPSTTLMLPKISGMKNH
jgi:hypothetical protein